MGQGQDIKTLSDSSLFLLPGKGNSSACLYLFIFLKSDFQIFISDVSLQPHLMHVDLLMSNSGVSKLEPILCHLSATCFFVNKVLLECSHVNVCN